MLHIFARYIAVKVHMTLYTKGKHSSGDVSVYCFRKKQDNKKPCARAQLGPSIHTLPSKWIPKP